MKFQTEYIQDIQKEVISLLPNDFMKETTLRYITGFKDTNNKILGLLSIQKLLISLNLNTEHIISCSFTICKPNENIPIHVDKGPYTLSINIPILNSKKTFVHFYESKEPPNEISITTPYLSFKEDSCNLLETVETDSPYIINTKIIHKVVNDTKNDRLMLLMRLNPNIEFSHFH